ncbi:MAG: hypothetical protein RL318_3153 [Fibrobacterota bacterium]|jgi:3-deoxy-D-manno-octulosonic-acid transferase
MRALLPFWYLWVVKSIGAILRFRKSARMGPWKFLPGKRVWIHAASLGECKASLSIVDWLPPGHEVVLTSTTSAGLAKLRAEAPQCPSFLCPFDDPALVDSFVNAFGVTRVLLIEAEVWPGWMAMLKRRGIPVAIVAVRVAGKSLVRWQRLWKVFPWIPESLDQVWANAGEVPRAREAGFLKAIPGASLKWAGHLPLEIQPTSGRHAALSLHRRDADALADCIALWGGHWLLFPRRLEDVAFWREWAKSQGLRLASDPMLLKDDEVWVAPAFGQVARLVPGCQKAWVSPGHDAWEPLFLGVPEVHPGARDRSRLDAYRARVDACLNEVLDWLRGP